MRLAADLSRNVDRMIYLPCVAVVLLALTRHPVFDNWDWSAGLLIVFAGCFLVIFYAALMLRVAAREGKRRIVADAQRLAQRAARRRPADSPATKRVERAIKSIEDQKQGAFSGLLDDPVLRAVLGTGGGLGTLALIDQLWRLT
jgi:hypothetical protein